jgi:hypothetical protein
MYLFVVLCTIFVVLRIVWFVSFCVLFVCKCTLLYCTVLYCTVLTVLYCTVLYCTVLYCTALHCTVLHCTVLHCTVLLPPGVNLIAVNKYIYILYCQHADAKVWAPHQICSNKYFEQKIKSSCNYSTPPFTPPPTQSNSTLKLSTLQTHVHYWSHYLLIPKHTLKKINIFNTILGFVWVWNLVAHIEGAT